MDRRDDERVPDVLVSATGAACGPCRVDWGGEEAASERSDYTTVSQLEVREPGTSGTHLPPAPSISRQDDSAGNQEAAAARETLPLHQVRTRVYIAGPISHGNTMLHIRRALQVATTLLKRGYAPYVPHLTCFWELASAEEFEHEDWMWLDFEFLAACDVLIRLPGESSGADREVELATKLKIPVYYSLDSLCCSESTVRMVG